MDHPNEMMFQNCIYFVEHKRRDSEKCLRVFHTMHFFYFFLGFQGSLKYLQKKDLFLFLEDSLQRRMFWVLKVFLQSQMFKSCIYVQTYLCKCACISQKSLVKLHKGWSKSHNSLTPGYFRQTETKFKTAECFQRF